MEEKYLVTIKITSEYDDYASIQLTKSELDVVEKLITVLNIDCDYVGFKILDKKRLDAE